MMDKGLLIGEICSRAGCTPRTVRHYETKGLFSPVTMTPGGRKIYGKEAVSIVLTAQLLRRLGYSLKDIRQIISLTNSKDTRHRRLTNKLRKLLSETLSSMDSELKRLTDSRKKVSDLLESTKICEECSPLDCKDCKRLEKLRTLGLLEV